MFMRLYRFLRNWIVVCSSVGFLSSSCSPSLGNHTIILFLRSTVAIFGFSFRVPNIV